jgi:copper chaperone
MESITLVAPDISCEHCQHAIEGAVSKMDGVQTVNVDIPTKTVHVEYNPQQVTLAKIEEVMDDTGYTVAK